MQHILIIGILLTFVTPAADAQRYLSRNTTVHFFSDAPLEKIEATNPKGVSMINLSTGEIESSILMKGFAFRKALMQQHFNENYVESDKYPKATFKGKVTNMPISLLKPGQYVWQISGDMNLHGKTNPVATSAQVQVDAKGSKITCSFLLKLSDYDIAIPALVKDNVSNTVKIDIAINDLKSM